MAEILTIQDDEIQSSGVQNITSTAFETLFNGREIFEVRLGETNILFNKEEFMYLMEEFSQYIYDDNEGWVEGDDDWDY